MLQFMNRRQKFFRNIVCLTELNVIKKIIINKAMSLTRSFTVRKVVFKTNGTLLYVQFSINYGNSVPIIILLLLLTLLICHQYNDFK